MTTVTDVTRTRRHLYEVLANPNPGVVQFYDDFFSRSVTRALEGSDEMKRAWFAMLFPAHSGREFLSMVREPLYASPAYQVTTKVMGVVTAMYERSTRDQRLEQRDLPTATGFIWLNEPLYLTDAGGARIATRAFSWGPQPPYLEDLGDGTSELSPPGTRMTAWCHTDDQDDFTDKLAAERLIAADMQLSISHSQYVPWGAVSRARRPGADVTPDDILRWVHTLWLFMGTEIVRIEQEAVARPERKRAQAVVGYSLVNVVTLRHVKVIRDGDSEPREVDWKCSWFRQSHWRHLDSYGDSFHRAEPSLSDQGRCVTCDARITKVRTHICDPAGKPLKLVPETLFLVSR